ncbi:MAG: bifunctional helix-turn-helix transcriptional regulator/GNAT family N-acetyltransferase [candidate division Zixibacteria bacterium]|nr:bifunctional helix-turn-helix transcriptional regulator/GNAT family N-acetyltransferase [candidate division Zixibacteria bacterium]
MTSQKPSGDVDILTALKELALASRLKRLSDQLLRDASRIYRRADLDFEARWFTVFYALAEKSPRAVTELAAHVGQSHPAVNQVVGAMTKRGLVSSITDPDDERRRLISLTPDGLALHQRLEPLWDDIAGATGDVINEAGPELLKLLDNLDAALLHRSIYDRVGDRQQSRRLDAVEIIDYRPAYRRYFRDLNYEWLNHYFTVEPSDEALLADPNGNVLKKGGCILFSRVDGEIVGTVALIRHSVTTLELAKMAVTERVRGRQVGRKLAQAAIERARSLGAERLILFTSPQLEAAVSLYHAMGFRDAVLPESDMPQYQRCTIAMTLDLTTRP